MVEKKDFLKIAVTGSAGSGKSLVCERFNQLGAGTLDCDAIARQVVEPGQSGLEKLVERFGNTILTDQKTLDRSVLRNILINQEGSKKEIEEILHPLIRSQMNKQIKTLLYKGKKKIVVVEVPLLFESGLDDQFDCTIVVASNSENLIERISQRDGVSKEDAKKILGLQMDQEEKKARADHVIINTQTPSELFESVDNLFDKIKKECLTI